MIDTLENSEKLKGLKFIDLFAGIGGFHYALRSFGAECVFASDIDKNSAQIYYENHRLQPAGDITQISAAEIPQHDILCGGFPCQAFSISGNRKGFEDTRGTLFFDIARITSLHLPSILFLENVKNFVRHDNGNTLETVLSTLSQLGYKVYYKVLNTSDFGLPQNRERVYIVAFRVDKYSDISFKFPSEISKSSLYDILEDHPEGAKVIERPDINIYKNINEDDVIFNQISPPNRPVQVGIVNKGGQGERIYHPIGHAITLSAYGGGVGAKTGLYKTNGVVRKLSPRECARVQGFPESFRYHSRTNEAYKQFGNSVSIDVLQHILIEIIKAIDKSE